MKTKHLVLTAATVLWGTTMLSQTGIVNAGSTPITYPVTYPTATPKPTAIPSSTPKPYGIHFQTQTVRLDADSFYIVAGNKVFTAKNSSINVNSDSGNPGYTTLELEWQEKGVEMRLFMYFKSDGKNWMSNEITTYNGQKQGNWIYYDGKFFQSPLGKIYTNPNFTISSSNSDIKGIKGTLHFTNLRLQAFTKATPTPTAYPITYPIPTVHPTPTAVPSGTPRPTPTAYPVTYPIPTPTPAPLGKISGRIYLMRFPFSRSKPDYSKIKITVTNIKNNFSINLPVDNAGKFSTTLVKGTYKVTPHVIGVSFYPQSRVVNNINGFASMHVDFFGLMF